MVRAHPRPVVILLLLLQPDRSRTRRHAKGNGLDGAPRYRLLAGYLARPSEGIVAVHPRKRGA